MDETYRHKISTEFRDAIDNLCALVPKEQRAEAERYVKILEQCNIALCETLAYLRKIALLVKDADRRAKLRLKDIEAIDMAQN